MPFKSQAQRRFMYAKHPAIAKEFESATPKGAHLPEHVPAKTHDGGSGHEHLTPHAKAALGRAGHPSY